MSDSVKILIIEPSILIRSGMIAVLHRLNLFQTDVFEMAGIEQLKTLSGWKSPDLLIINPTVPGALSLQQIKKETGNSHLKCIALQNSLFDSLTLKLYDEVISIYDSADQINEKLTRLMSEPKSEDKRHELLSVREKEIIICVIKGMTNKQIAEQLYLSAHTVVSHRRNIAAKLQIHSTAGLTIYAIVNKLVGLDEIKVNE